MHTFEDVALQIENAQDSEMLHAFVWGLKDRVHKVTEVRLRGRKEGSKEVSLCDPKTL